jgi:hypothetical protein
VTDPTPARDVVFLDVETNGLDPRRHEAWDVAAWNLSTGHRCEFFTWLPDVSGFLAAADVKALRVSRFLDRYPWDACPGRQDTETALAAMGGLLYVFDGGRSMSAAESRDHPAPIVVGSKPTFDMEFTSRLLARYDMPDTPWHHHPIDLGTYAAGVVGIEPGTSSLSAENVARLCHVEPGGHAAAADVTSGGRAFLLLREAARLVNHGDKILSATEYLADHAAHRERESAIEAELLRPAL